MIATRVNSPVVTTQIPPELLRSTPRDITLTSPGKLVISLAVLLAVAALGSAVFFYLDHTRQNADYLRLTGTGVLIEARVIETGYTSGENPRRFVVYEYSAGNQTFRRRAILHRKDHREAHIGSTITVRYVPAEPALSRLAGYERPSTPVWLVGAVPPCLLIFIVSIVWVVRRESYLLSKGRPALACVTAAKCRGRYKNASNYRVEYEFQILSGACRKGRYDVQRNVPQPGATLIVLYDRDRPERSVPYPLTLVRLR